MEAPVIWDEGFNLTQLIYVVELQLLREQQWKQKKNRRN